MTIDDIHKLIANDEHRTLELKKTTLVNHHSCDIAEPKSLVRGVPRRAQVDGRVRMPKEANAIRKHSRHISRMKKHIESLSSKAMTIIHSRKGEEIAQINMERNQRR